MRLIVFIVATLVGSGSAIAQSWREYSYPEATDFGQPTAAVTRWRVSALPSTHCLCRASGAPDGSLS
jgi:hypothetical protein